MSKATFADRMVLTINIGPQENQVVHKIAFTIIYLFNLIERLKIVQTSGSAAELAKLSNSTLRWSSTRPGTMPCISY